MVRRPWLFLLGGPIVAADSEDICWRFIRWCEDNRLLNSECNLSTIEYIRSREPAQALEYVNKVLVRYGCGPWTLEAVDAT